MVSREEVLQYLPGFKDRCRVVNWGQSTDIIGSEIIEAHDRFAYQYDNIYPLFNTGDIYTTCQRLWDFCKYELRYTKEEKSEQSVKNPTAILQSGEKIDCKHYSLFIGGVLDAIKRNNRVNWTWFYRLVSEREDQQIGHIFPVVLTGGREIWIDPVMSGFNEKSNWTYYEDIAPMPVYEISGLDGSDKPKFAVVDKIAAEQAFLKSVNLNLFGYKDILLSDSSILFGAVKNWYDANGYNFNQLLLILNA